MNERTLARAKELETRFHHGFSAIPDLTTYGPGRVDLLGSHTDYNEGFVLPVAIDVEIIAVGRARQDDTVRLWSEDFRQLSQFSLENIEFDNQHKWSNYARGVIVYLRKAGHDFTGADVLLSGNVPIGSGLSSSAAMEMAVATLFQALFGLSIDPVELALIGQRAENQFVGINTGIMDQFASRLGKHGHALFVDCRSLGYELVPLPNDSVKIVVADTMKRRGLVGSEYNVRRSQCEEAAAALGVKALRDANMEQLAAHRAGMPETLYKRAEHVICENERVLRSRDLLRSGDLTAFAQLMNASHDSARDLYDVSCAELETMVEAARHSPGVLGSRMAGAGFGGCTVSLVEAGAVDEFKARVATDYKAATGVQPNIHVCNSADGAGVIEGVE